MILGIDHIVIAGPDLDALASAFAAIGFNVAAGGRHPIGSYNRLIGFEDGSYIELLSFYEDSPAHYWWEAVHGRGGGLIDFCMRTDDIEADYALFRAQGVRMSPLVGLSRLRDDGYRLAWRNNEIRGLYQGLIPFLIEDETPRSERVPKETRHDNGVIGIDSITLVASDIDLARRIMSAALNQPGQPTRDAALNASGRAYRAGPHGLEYLTPDAEDSPLAEHIALNKPLPYRIRLKTGGKMRTVDPGSAAGARIEFV